jgi:tetratricopeptide (TPR) repeat protein
MLDGELYGADPAGHHLTSVLLHAMNAALLLLALQRLTGSFWPSLLAAALFAVHPLRVESVVWVSERKDVLSGLFWMLALLAYVWYTERPGRGRYLLLAVCFALGLLSKPMVVTLPFVLLLLDVWPLRRFGPAGEGGERQSRLLLEKLPLIALALASAVVTWLSAQGGGAMGPGADWSPGVRLANAAVSYVAYLGAAIWPARLACFYPHPGLSGGPSVLLTAGAVALLAGLSVLALFQVKRRPYGFVGWAWFLGALVPAIGVVQVGYQARADRYTYLPLIGIGIVLAWSLEGWVGRRAARRRVLVVVGSLVLLALIVATRQQLGHWKDSRSLFERALAVTSDNYVAHYGLAMLFDEQGDLERATVELERTLTIRPEFAAAHNLLGDITRRRGDATAARRHFERAIEISPDFAAAHGALGSLLETQDQLDLAAAHLETALRLDPDQARTHNNLGIVHDRGGRPDRARTAYERALELDPWLVDAQVNLGFLEERQGRHREAVRHYSAALASDPARIQAAEGLAWLSAASADPAVRNGRLALEWAERCATATDHARPGCLEALAAAQAELGRFDEATQWLTRALELAPPARAPDLGRRLELYRAGRVERVRPAE